MKLAREIEDRLERLVDGATAAVFRGKMHPVDMAERLIRQADFLAYDGPAGPQIPNRWVMRINPLDLPDGVDHDQLGAELAAALTTTSLERAWRLTGPISVEVVTDDQVPRGLTDCTGESEPGTLPSWGQLVAVRPPLALDLSDNRSTVGRALDSDVVANLPEVSRHQAVIVRQGNAVTIVDARSSNGTFVNGRKVDASPRPLVPGDTVRLGMVDFTFRLL
jgi:FHA domain/FhaA, N-terminal domain